MCGRKYTDERLTWAMYRDQLELFTPPPATNFAPNYNIAPTHEVPVCVFENTERMLKILQWGLLPFWAKDRKTGYSMINAKAETLEEKRSFAPLLKSGRCVIPVSGFYEWKRWSKTEKQAHAICRSDGAPMLLAGLWTRNSVLEAETYTIITRAPNGAMAEIHNRMPLILEQDQIACWLEAGWQEAKPLLGQVPTEDALNIWQVSNEVGKVSVNHKGLIDPVG